MCKPGYIKRLDGFIWYVTCCSSDNCNKEFTENQIENILTGNVAGNAENLRSFRFSVYALIFILFFQCF